MTLPSLRVALGEEFNYRVMPTAPSTLCAVAADGSSSAPTVIVGTGPVGIHAAHELLRRDAQHPLVVYGDELWSYNRARLSSLVAGEISWGEVYNPLRPPSGSQVISHYDRRVRAIDRDTRAVIDATGRRQAYTTLILATGARPRIPAISNLDLPGVQFFHDLLDTEMLLARSAQSRHTLVWGGGVLGLEIARALHSLDISVGVVHHEGRLMSRQLDATAAALLHDHILALGIEVFTGRNIRSIQGSQTVSGVLLSDGTELACDTLVVATGVRPNIELARDAGLRVHHGVVVNERMQTSDPNIYAVGDCAEYGHHVSGTVAPGFEQAAVAAHCLLGGRAVYRGSLSAVQLKIFELPVWSVGRISEEEQTRTVRDIAYQSAAGGYRKLVLERNRLIGLIGIGQWPELPRLHEAVTATRRLWPWHRFRFRRYGRIWSEQLTDEVAQWPDTTTVCHCTRVTRGQLGRAMTEGCHTLTTLAERTGASQVCGSCAPLLAQLLGEMADPRPSPGRKSLGAGSVLAVLLVTLVCVVPAVPFVETVQGGWKLEVLWSDGWWKQFSGYSIVALSAVGLLISLRKRWPVFSFADFAWWRAVHAALGVLTLLALVAHTGFSLGNNANLYLMTNFLALAAVGGLAAGLAAGEQRWSGRRARRLRHVMTHSHIFLLWPLLVFLGFHILSVYYY